MFLLFVMQNNRLTKRIQAGGSDTTDYYTMNIGDQLTERVKKHTQSQVVIEEEEYTYSDNGHMTSRVLTTGGNDYTTSYQYDVGGNLKQVTLPDSATVTFQYDAYGNRVKKQTSTEKVSYEYAGGSCQREIHRNPSDTILYTLRYYAWGFTKTVPGTPDVTTAYYYLVDTRGWVWGLTDSDGAILETYQYSPYGELLSTPTITHSRFLSGADECLWDSETGLYYLHARYYDPQLGRFIQEDIVEGDLESPASQNPYTYCQNDPVSLVDPSGYSPQNTNTPTRFGQFNIANLDSPYGCSLSDLQPVLPELQPSSGGEVIGAGEMFVYDSCNKVSRLMGSNDMDGADRKMEKGWGFEIITVDGVNYKVCYGLDENGIPVVTVRTMSGDNTSPAIEIEHGINAALFDLYNDGFFDQSNDEIADVLNIVSLRNRLQEIGKFTSNLTSFAGVVGYRQGYRGEFFYHATIGSAIADNLAKEDHTEVGDAIYKGLYDFYNPLIKAEDPDANERVPRGCVNNKDFNQYDMEIGFWVSFYNTERKLGLSFFDSLSSIGMVGLGNIIKAMIKQESSFNGYDGKQVKRHYVDGTIANDGWGLMAVGRSQVEELNKWMGLSFDVNSFGPSSTNSFTNIGAGIGHLMIQKYYNECGEYNKPGQFDRSFINKGDNSLEAWLVAVKCYNGKGASAALYRAIIRERYRRYSK